MDFTIAENVPIFCNDGHMCCSMVIASCSLGTITAIYTADTAIFFRWFYNTVQYTSVPDGLPGPALCNTSQRNPLQTHSCTNDDSDPFVILPSRMIFAHISHTVLSVGKPLQGALVMCWSSNYNHCVSYWHNPFLCLKMHCLLKTLLIPAKILGRGGMERLHLLSAYLVFVADAKVSISF